MKKRCPWVGEKQIYIEYHDKEWGVPVCDDDLMFEFLLLESFQAGLSWITILKKRENFRRAFDNFDFRKIVSYDEKKINSLLGDKGIIRNKLKIRAAVNNSAKYIEIIEKYGSFCTYFWSFTDGKPRINEFKDLREIPVTTELSDTISKDLKKRGFKFIGSTVVYAHMQAVGMVNDHLVSCFRHKEIVDNY